LVGARMAYGSSGRQTQPLTHTIKLSRWIDLRDYSGTALHAGCGQGQVTDSVITFAVEAHSGLQYG
jgi:hypothetical protein